MNVLQKFWAILLGLVQRGMSKFRVIYQIGLIILVMAFFLGVQGMMALNTFNKMQTVTQNVFSCSIKGFLSTASIRQEMAYIQNQYTQSLLDNRPLTVTFDNVETAIQALKADSVAASDTGFTSIENQVAEIKKLLASPVSRENYQKLNQSADLVAMNIKSFESTLNLNAISSMERGNEFFRNSRNTNILLLIISLALSIVMGSTVAALIAKPLKEMVAVAGLLAAGDFTRVLKVKGNLEINQLVDGLNYAIGSLRALVSNINEQAKNLAIAGRELNDASHESGKSASEVARAMESMALSTAEQTDQINQTANTMNTLGKLVEKVSGDSLNIAQTSEKVAAAAQNGQQIASNVAVRMNEVYRSTKEVNEVIGDMSRDSEQIREIAALIGGIAEQTSLLALNAAIEAARAGIHGRGFSVVAEETGKLADQSKQASLKIDSLVNEMMSRNKQATEAIGKGVDEVEKGKLLTSVATTTFESIFQEIEAMLSQIHIVAKSAQQMANGNEKVIEAITSVAAISEEGMATTEEISATVEEQSASAEQVAALAGNLLQIAENMKRSVGTFRF